MIESLKLKFGRTATAAAEEIRTTPITVFVGPNNSGKSKILSEIDSYCVNGFMPQGKTILESINFARRDLEQTKKSVSRIQVEPSLNEAIPVDHIIVASSRHGRQQIEINTLLNIIQEPHQNISGFCQWFLRHNVMKLDGSSRINLVTEQTAGDLQQPAHTSFQLLLRDDIKRKEVRRIVSDAFQTHFVIDPTNLGRLRIRLSDRAPANELEERGIHKEAVAFHAAAQPIELASDGVKAFTGIITEIIAGDPEILLIDEPEAFLHPSLAYKLGNEISRAAVGSNKRVFVSTHSPQFVMGCIQSGAPVNIIRLTYRSGVATARILPSSELLELMRNPLLRSTGVISGLFYEFVVVTESDADRAFYQEINERLLRFKPDWGVPNCLFINAQNKQTIHTILRPLRKLGIPAAGVVDVDVLKEGGTVWSNMLQGSHMPDLAQSSMATLRIAIKNAMDKTGKDMKRDGGLAILNGSNRQAAEDLLATLGRYGVFVVPGGELESWLKHLGASRHGPAWLVDIFERMGEDPANAGYVRPAEDDVWKFLQSIRFWLVDPARQGIPD